VYTRNLGQQFGTSIKLGLSPSLIQVSDMVPFLIIFLGLILAFAVVSDLRFQRIPNVLTFAAIAVGLVYHWSTDGFEGLFFSAKGLGLGVSILILPYLFGAMGAGDVKLMGAVGAILGPMGLFVAFLFTAISGGVYGLAVLIRRQIRDPGVESQNRPRLCYGVAIAVGTTVSVFLGLSGYRFPI